MVETRCVVLCTFLFRSFPTKKDHLGIIVSSGVETRHRTIENPRVVRFGRLTRTDGIKSSEARGDGVANLNFPSCQPSCGWFYIRWNYRARDRATARYPRTLNSCLHYANDRRRRLTDGSSPRRRGKWRRSMGIDRWENFTVDFARQKCRAVSHGLEFNFVLKKRTKKKEEKKRKTFVISVSSMTRTTTTTILPATWKLDLSYGIVKFLSSVIILCTVVVNRAIVMKKREIIHQYHIAHRILISGLYH